MMDLKPGRLHVVNAMRVSTYSVNAKFTSLRELTEYDVFIIINDVHKASDGRYACDVLTRYGIVRFYAKDMINMAFTHVARAINSN